MKCPRCGEELSAAFYGPCISCRYQLRQWAAERTATRAYVHFVLRAMGHSEAQEE